VPCARLGADATATRRGVQARMRGSPPVDSPTSARPFGSVAGAPEGRPRGASLLVAGGATVCENGRSENVCTLQGRSGWCHGPRLPGPRTGPVGPVDLDRRGAGGAPGPARDPLPGPRPDPGG